MLCGANRKNWTTERRNAGFGGRRIISPVPVVSQCITLPMSQILEKESKQNGPAAAVSRAETPKNERRSLPRIRSTPPRPPRTVSPIPVFRVDKFEDNGVEYYRHSLTVGPYRSPEASDDAGLVATRTKEYIPAHSRPLIPDPKEIKRQLELHLEQKKRDEESDEEFYRKYLAKRKAAKQEAEILESKARNPNRHNCKLSRRWDMVCRTREASPSLFQNAESKVQPEEIKPFPAPQTMMVELAGCSIPLKFREFVPNAVTHLPASSKNLELNELLALIKEAKIRAPDSSELRSAGNIDPEVEPIQTTEPNMKSPEPGIVIVEDLCQEVTPVEKIQKPTMDESHDSQLSSSSARKQRTRIRVVQSSRELERLRTGGRGRGRNVFTKYIFEPVSDDDDTPAQVGLPPRTLE